MSLGFILQTVADPYAYSFPGQNAPALWTPEARQAMVAAGLPVNLPSDYDIAQLASGAKVPALTPEDQGFLEAFYRWSSSSDPSNRFGMAWSRLALIAARAILAGDTATLNKAQAWMRDFEAAGAQGAALRTGGKFGAGTDAIRAELAQLQGSKAIPALVTRPLYYEGGEEPLILQRTVPPAKASAMGALMGMVAKIPAEDYIETRRAELAEAAAKVDRGDVNSNDAPELAAQALEVHAEIDQQLLAAEREVDQLLAQAELAENRIAAAKAEIAGSQEAPSADGLGLGLSLKSVLKGITRTWKDEVVDRVQRIRDDLAQRLLPAGVREFGRQIDRERKRFGRRVDAEVMREIASVAQYAPWIKALSGLLMFTPLGFIGYILLVGAISGVELTYAYRVKREIDGKLRELMRQVRAEVARLQAEAAKLEADVARLRALRAEMSKAFAQLRSEELADVSNRVLGISSAATTYSAIAAAGGLIAGVGAWRALTRRPWGLLLLLGGSAATYMAATRGRAGIMRWVSEAP